MENVEPYIASALEYNVGETPCSLSPCALLVLKGRAECLPRGSWREHFLVLPSPVLATTPDLPQEECPPLPTITQSIYLPVYHLSIHPSIVPVSSSLCLLRPLACALLSVPLHTCMIVLSPMLSLRNFPAALTRVPMASCRLPSLGACAWAGRAHLPPTLRASSLYLVHSALLIHWVTLFICPPFCLNSESHEDRDSLLWHGWCVAHSSPSTSVC